MKRRDFLAVAAAATAGMAHGRQIEKNGWRLEVDAEGNLLTLRKGTRDFIHFAPERNKPNVTGPARVTQEVRMFTLPDGGIVIRQRIGVERTGAANEPVTVRIPRLIRLGDAEARGLYPMQDGVARKGTADERATFRFAGEHPGSAGNVLAVPAVQEWSPKFEWRITYCADPTFTTAFGEHFSWTYPANPGVPAGEVRNLYTCLHKGEDLDSLMQAFYASALGDVPAGPEWLHDIAMVDYDFLSDGGKGWFRDIDTLEQIIPPLDRKKVILALHGWYDYCGRYSFDYKTGKLDTNWTALPNALDPEFRKKFDQPMGANAYQWPREVVFALEPIPMSIAAIHERIRYAKRRGFRVALYFADGLNACDGIPGFDPAKVLRWGGWTGPETKGKSYSLNPLHPEVPLFFKRYLAALLNEYGNEVDALVWDETFYIQGGDLGTPQAPGYAGRAMMQLVKDLTLMTTAHRADLAFLASDCLGMGERYQAPYCLVAHGTYEDTGCNPKGWPYQILPNYRNVMWSCQWAPTKVMDRTRYAAEVFDVPVAISNGYGEDKGVSEMGEYELPQIQALFKERSQRRMKIGWIEESGSRKLYLGRQIRSS